MSVLVYEDFVHNKALLLRALEKHFGADHVAMCSAADIKNGILTDKIRLLVFPGGADLYYVERLNGAGNAAIRIWVEQGGTYLGICAGAYYACRSLTWAKGTKQEISGSRELNFFNGEAIGPIWDFIEDRNIEKSWQQAVTLSRDNGEKVKVHYEAGPYFTGGDNHKILARYQDIPEKPAAIIECAVGQGRAVLCGPHPENSASELALQNYKNENKSYAWTTQVIDELRKDEAAGRKFWSALLDHCINPA